MVARAVETVVRAADVKMGDRVSLHGQPARLVMQVRVIGEIVRLSYTATGTYTETPVGSRIRVVRANGKTVDRDLAAKAKEADLDATASETAAALAAAPTRKRAPRRKRVVNPDRKVKSSTEGNGHHA